MARKAVRKGKKKMDKIILGVIIAIVAAIALFYFGLLITA